MDGPRDYYLMWSQTNMTNSISFIGGFLNDYRDELICKTETDSDFKNKLRVIKRKRWGMDKLGIWQ